MDGDFEGYERDYLKRFSKSHGSTESYGMRQARLRKDAAIKSASKERLDSWDYAILDAIRRGDVGMQLKFGTMRTAESLLRLYCHGFIYRPDCKATFDMLERIQAIMDSAAYRQYKDRLKRIMTKEIKKRLDLINDILDVRGIDDMLEITVKGRDALKAKRAETATLYEKMSRQYAENRAGFYEAASSYERALPMLVMMGFSGAVMGYMLASSDTQYAALGHVHAPVQWDDLGPGGDDFGGSDFGFDGGW